MAVVIGRSQEQSGIALGGLGTGSVEIRSDGEFHQWQIANNGEWKEDCRETELVEDNSIMKGSGLTFFVRTNQDDTIKVRKLGLSVQEREIRSLMFSWLKPVEEIVFDGQGATAKLNYVDESLPITIESIAMSPMIPHDEIASSVPGFYMTFRVKNNTSERIRVSLLGKLENPICFNEPNRMLKNKVIQDESTTRIVMATNNSDAFCASNGSMCFSVEGGEVSWISGDYRSFIDSYISSTKEFGVSEESILFPFRKHGTLPNTNTEQSLSYEVFLPDSQLNKLTDEELATRVKLYRTYAFAQSLEKRIMEVDSDFFTKRSGQISFLKLIRDSVNQFEGESHKDSNWGDCALNSSFDLEANDTKEIRFIISWYFPNHYSKNGYRLGHMYENKFADALDVNIYLNKKYIEYNKKATDFIACLRNTNIDSYVMDSWLIHLTTLIKCSWWIKDGRFAIWEGIGSCGFHTTDITYHASFNLLAIYPNLQKKQMLMGADFQNEKGRVHHFFTPDLSSVDNGFERVDMNSQFVLLVCRDYLWTGDREYLDQLYGNVTAAIDSLMLLDSDQDGLLDVDTKHNTYDAWNFYGAPSYIESLWLSCLKAGAFLAKEKGDMNRVEQYTYWLNIGKSSMEKMLWNGKYFDLWVDGELRDQCCMTDQLDGEWFIRLIGLGGILSDNQVKTAIETIMKENYSDENGLINASYPKNTTPTIYTHRNCQAEANWTGIEYAFASFLYLFGMEEMGRKIVKTVDQRYKRSARVWNHMECGDHYYRAMSSWSTLLAFTGFSVDAGRNEVSVCPGVSREVRGPWFTTSGYGTLCKSKNLLKIQCVSGELFVNRIVSDFGGKLLSVLVNGRDVCCGLEHKNGLDCVVFEQGLGLVLGDELIIVGEG